MGKIILLVVAALLALIGVKIHQALQLVPPPVLDEPWWGPGAPGKDDTAIKPFKINIPDEILLDLKQRLNNKRGFQTALENSDHHYGINANLLEDIVTFWKDEYDWRQREKYLNKYPQFKTKIQGLDIHYIHVKPQNVKGKRVLPMMLMHGWPGSVREFYELIPLLTTPRADRDYVFELVIPSIPGYGFSQAASKQGLGFPQVAVIFKNLMMRLGFNKYYLQGGDWGAGIGTAMSSLFEKNVLGLHLNFCYSQAPISNLKFYLGSLYPSAVVEKEFEHKLYPLSEFWSNAMLEFGYMHIQSTKPDTVGVSLNDSPVGLAAYILEKFITWTNPNFKSLPDGGLKSKFKSEDLLDNIMIYWVSNSITTSMRLYSESMRISNFALNLDGVGVHVPTACAKFKHELLYQPEHMIADKYTNVVQTSVFADGGHFAALELPAVLADDIWSAVAAMQKKPKKL